MSPAHRRFLFIEQSLGSAIVNLAIAAFLGWLLFRRVEPVPIWGSQGLVVDTILTALLVPLFTCLAVTCVARRQVRNGRIGVIDSGTLSHWMPEGILMRAFLIGVVCMAIVSPVVLAFLKPQCHDHFASALSGFQIGLRHRRGRIDNALRCLHSDLGGPRVIKEQAQLQLLPLPSGAVSASNPL